MFTALHNWIAKKSPAFLLLQVHDEAECKWTAVQRERILRADRRAFELTKHISRLEADIQGRETERKHLLDQLKAMKHPATFRRDSDAKDSGGIRARVIPGIARSNELHVVVPFHDDALRMASNPEDCIRWCNGIVLTEILEAITKHAESLGVKLGVKL